MLIDATAAVSALLKTEWKSRIHASEITTAGFPQTSRTPRAVEANLKISVQLGTGTCSSHGLLFSAFLVIKRHNKPLPVPSVIRHLTWSKTSS